MNIDGLLFSGWDRTFCWWLSVALISGSGFQKIIYSAIRCPLHKACFSSCSFLTAVTVAGVSAQPGCDTSIGSILVLHSVAVAVAASVENTKITVRKRVWRVFNLETLSPPGLTFALHAVVNSGRWGFNNATEQYFLNGFFLMKYVVWF